MWHKHPLKNLVLALSATFFLLATWPYPWYIILVGGLSIYIIHRMVSRKISLATCTLTFWERMYLYGVDLSVGYYLAQTSEYYLPSVEKISPLCYYLIGFGAIPFVHFVYGWIWSQLRSPVILFCKSLKRHEKYLLGFSMLFLTTSLLYSSFQSSVWVAPTDASPENVEYLKQVQSHELEGWNPLWNKENVSQNFFFSTDCATWTLFQGESCWTINRFPHPWYSYVLFPFYPILYMVAGGLWLLKFGCWHYAFAGAMGLLQIFLWVTGGIFLKKLLEEVTDTIFSSSAMLFYLFSFPVLFTGIPERLILSLFTLLVFLYFRKFHRNTSEPTSFSSVDYILGLSAVGTTMASLLMVGVAWLQSLGERRNFGKKFLTIAIVFLATTILLAPSIMLNIGSRIHGCFAYTPDKLEDCQQYTQYIHFLESNLFWPSWKEVSFLKGNENFPFRLAIVDSSPKDIPQIYLVTGGMIGFFCLLSLILYRKSWFVQMAGIWFLFSVFLLGVLGYGAKLNEMTLYVTYFSWAILPLAVLPLYSLFRFRPTLASILVLGMALFALSQNAYFSLEILNLAKDIYTVP